MVSIMGKESKIIRVSAEVYDTLEIAKHLSMSRSINQVLEEFLPLFREYALKWGANIKDAFDGFKIREVTLTYPVTGEVRTPE